MSTPEQFARELLDKAMEFGDEDSKASQDAIAVLHALAFGRAESLREVVKEIMEERKCPEL
jgi:hypothetical protein